MTALQPQFVISSPQNNRIKGLLKLRERKTRLSRGVFGVEGSREISHALLAGFELKEFFYCPTRMSEAAMEIVGEAQQKIGSSTAIEVSDSVYERIAVRESADGIIGVFKANERALATLSLPAFPLILAVHKMEKPGNLGALLRTCDATGVDAVVLVDECVDPFNPNVIRASIGTVFQTPVVSATSAEFAEFCGDSDIQIVAAIIGPESQHYSEVNFRRGTAVLLGSEAYGLGDYWQEKTDVAVQIPMQGVADSLNVSTAGAVILYEAVRQRAN